MWTTMFLVIDVFIVICPAKALYSNLLFRRTATKYTQQQQMIPFFNRLRHRNTRKNNHHPSILLMIVVWASSFHSFSRAFSRSLGNLTTPSVLQKVLERSIAPIDSATDNMNSFETFASPHLRFLYRTEPISSTQDEMRTILHDKEEHTCVALVATTQTAGRGTQGRLWKAASGNLYLTVALPSPIPVPLTLLPLQVGILVAERVHAIVRACSSSSKPKVTVKWPNDVLINDAKVSGCLIEHFSNDRNLSWFLVGIGVNVAETPPLQGLPGSHKRAPTSLQEWCPEASAMASVLGLDIANALADWVIREEKNDGQQIVQEWRKWAEFGKLYELRGSVVDEEQGGFEGEVVVTVDIQADGQLRVRDQQSRERLLVADYLV